MKCNTVSHYAALLALAQLTCMKYSMHLSLSMIQKNNYNPPSMNIIWNEPRNSNYKLQDGSIN